MIGVALNSDQASCLWDVATHIDPAIDQISWAIVGIADLAEPEAARGLIHAMQGNDWQAASSYRALAGRNNLLAGFLIRFDDKNHQYAWALLRLPFEPLESTSLEAWGRAHESSVFPAGLPWTPLTHEDIKKGRQ